MGRITGSSEKKLFVKCRHEGSDQYTKVVEWSEEDQCYVGSIPGWVGSCCHGDNEEKVYHELCQIADEWIDIYNKEGLPLPQQTNKK